MSPNYLKLISNLKTKNTACCEIKKLAESKRLDQ